MDTIQNMLRGMRLTSGLFLEAEFTAPWCVTSQVTPEDCAPFAPIPRQIISYHYVTAGRMLVKVSGVPPVVVEQGEIVVLPRNDPHVIGSALNIRPLDVGHPVNADPRGGLTRIVLGGGGARTNILCGFLGDDMPYNPMIAMLPAVLKQNVVDGASGNWIEGAYRQAAKELADGQAGSPLFLARLAELLFLEAVRRYLATQPPGARQAGMQDQAIGRALGLLHGQLARRWTTDDLAQEIGMSRSAFADRFTKAVGEPPMRYLSQQRLAHACLLLKERSTSVASIAYEVGYESEAAFSRAFRREHGAPPAAWRERAGVDETASKS
jgi:AraC-like DNA-binding protein